MTSKRAQSRRQVGIPAAILPFLLPIHPAMSAAAPAATKDGVYFPSAMEQTETNYIKVTPAGGRRTAQSKDAAAAKSGSRPAATLDNSN
jgi:hypothetical protein